MQSDNMQSANIQSDNTMLTHNSNNSLGSTDLQSFSFQVNRKINRKKALEISSDNLKNGFKQLCKYRASENWSIVSPQSDIVEAYADYLKRGLTTRLTTCLGGEGEEFAINAIGVCLDFDTSSVVQTFSNALTGNSAALYYMTPSYIEGENEKHRLVFFFTRVCDAVETKIILLHLQNLYHSCDKSCSDISRLFFPSSSDEDVFIINKYNRLDVDSILSTSCKTSDFTAKETLTLLTGENKRVVTKSKKDSFNLGQMKKSTESTESLDESITDKVLKYLKPVWTDLFNSDPNNFQKFLSEYGIGHDFEWKEVRPLSTDKDVIRKWVGRNLPCHRKPETRDIEEGGKDALVLVEKENDLFPQFYFRNGGEDGSLTTVHILYYWYTVNQYYKNKWTGKEFKAVFKDVVKHLCESLGIEPFEFPRKKRTKSGASEIQEALDEILKDTVRYNSFTAKFEYYSEELDIDTEVLFDCPTVQFFHLFGVANVPIKLLIENIYWYGKQNEYHPFAVFLKENYEKHKDKLKDYDGINSVSTRYFGTDKEIYNVYIRKTLIGAIKRALNSKTDYEDSSELGTKFDTCTVLQGKQGTGKSTFWRKLISVSKKFSFFSDSLNFESSDKDEKLKINRAVIHEMSEIDALFSRKDISAFKAFLSTQADIYRAPYEKDTHEHPRRSIFVGSVNEPEFLTDISGDRRYWVIPCGNEKFNLDPLKEEKYFLWAKAYELYLSGETCYLSSEEEEERREKNQEFRNIDALGETFLPTIEKYKSIRISDIFTYIFNRRDFPKSEQMRVSNILKENGWIRKRKTNDVLWVNPDPNVTEEFSINSSF